MLRLVTMYGKFLCGFVVCLYFGCLSAQDFRIMSYNVENFFDTVKNPCKDDGDFTPDGKYKWTNRRFIKKRDNIADAVVGCAAEKIPDLIALCEVENEFALNRLVEETALKRYVYEFVHRDSPDARGMDVALLYRPSTFSLICVDFFTLSDSVPDSREILYAKGVTSTKDTLHVFVNHWPSKRDGAVETEPRRMNAAKVLRQAVDSIFMSNPSALICATGDFNDLPDSRPITEVLKAESNMNKIDRCGIYNLSYRFAEEGRGTIRFRKKWETVDMFFVSGSVIEKYDLLNAEICDKDFLLETTTAGNIYPKRTYKGPIYAGGYSDHLPIILDFYRNKLDARP